MEVGLRSATTRTSKRLLRSSRRKKQYHSLRVYNSQFSAAYNKKRSNAKNPYPPVDTGTVTASILWLRVASSWWHWCFAQRDAEAMPHCHSKYLITQTQTECRYWLHLLQGAMCALRWSARGRVEVKGYLHHNPRTYSYSKGCQVKFTLTQWQLSVSYTHARGLCLQ